jgi:hypothetical protein
MNAIDAALMIASQAGPGYGVGVDLADDGSDAPFVQWVRDEDGGLTHVEVHIPDRDRAAIAAVEQQGFARDPHLETLGIWTYESDQPLLGARTDADVRAGLLALVMGLGPSAATRFSAYP